MWKPDGRSYGARIGLLTPHLDPVPESEFQALAPAGVSIHAARVPLGMVGPDGVIVPRVDPETACAFAEPPAVDEAASLLAAVRPHAVVYAFTSSSYILGAAADESLKARLEGRTGGIPVVIQTQSLVLALKALGARRIALVHPPWFSPELDGLGSQYFEERGFGVVSHGAAPLRTDYGDLHPRQVYEWVVSRAPPSADAIVLGGGGFRAIGAVAALESALGRPVLSANQAAFWAALRTAETGDMPDGYGCIFAKPLPQPAT